MTNAETVFNAAMALMDELNASTGAPDANDTAEYRARTLPILNVLRGELYPYSDTYRVTETGRRPILAAIVNFEDEIGLDDYICQSVLPYGLAAHLLLDEDPTSASYYNQRYEELKSLLTRGLPAESVDIVDVYGGGYNPHNDFGYWG